MPRSSSRCARLEIEIEIVIGRLLERLPDLRPVPGELVRMSRNPILATIESMPVEFTPRG